MDFRGDVGSFNILEGEIDEILGNRLNFKKIGEIEEKSEKLKKIR